MKNILALILIALLTACGETTVQRVSTDAQTDLSGYWNDSDSKLVSEEMVKTLQDQFWLGEFTGKKGRKPLVIIGNVKNKTSEHLNTNTFIKDMEKQLINGGRVKFVASTKERDDVRDERMDQQGNASMENAKNLGNEAAADFMLIGEISSISDQAGGEKVVYYQVNLELIDIETNEKIWVGDKKIKKLVSKDGYKL
jgi:uncharacterized protein (TIGR02722 family)